MRTFGTIKTLLAVAVLSLGLVACKSHLETGGAYAPGSTTYTTNADATISTNVVETAAPDLALFNIDSAFDLAYTLADTVFKQEKANRALLQSISPDIKLTLDKIRPDALEARNRYVKARRIYSLNPTPAGLSDLRTILSQMQNFSSAAQGALPRK